MAQVRRFQRIDFGMAALLLAYVLALSAAAAATAMREGLSLERVAVLFALIALDLYLWRVTRRRWRRLA